MNLVSKRDVKKTFFRKKKNTRQAPAGTAKSKKKDSKNEKIPRMKNASKIIKRMLSPRFGKSLILNSAHS